MTVEIRLHLPEQRLAHQLLMVSSIEIILVAQVTDVKGVAQRIVQG